MIHAFDDQRGRSAQRFDASLHIGPRRALGLQEIPGGCGSQSFLRRERAHRQHLNSLGGVLLELPEGLVGIDGELRLHHDRLSLRADSHRAGKGNHDLRMGVEPFRISHRHARSGQGSPKQPQRVVVRNKPQITVDSVGEQPPMPSTGFGWGALSSTFHSARKRSREYRGLLHTPGPAFPQDVQSRGR